MARKRKQGFVKQFNAGNMFFVNNEVHVNTRTVNKLLADGSTVEKELTVVPMGENRLFRKFGGNMNVEGPADWTNFAVVSGDANDVDAMLLTTIIDEGFIHNGKRYKCIMRSASGMRLAKALFTSVPELWESIDDVTFADLGKALEDRNGKVQMSKIRTREGLALTTTTEVDVEFTHGVIDDFSRTIEIEGRQYIDGVMQDVKVEVSLTPTDGMGFMSYEVAVEIARELELSYVPTAFQVRFAGAKGLLVVYKWDRKAKAEWDKDVLFLDSMWKYDFDEKKYNRKKGNGPKLEIASWVKPAKSEYVNLTYQFIQALDIKPEDLLSLAKEALDKVETGVLTDVNKAKLFLGMLDASGDDEYDDKLVSTLTRTLDADESMLQDIYVQRKLRGMMERFIKDMRRGKVPVAGFYRYIIADPSVIFGNEDGVLQAGEYYHNGENKLYAGFRSPLIHSSEAVKLQMVPKAEFEGKENTEYTEGFGRFTYLKDLIVFNTYDDTLPRMGGADVDGDKIMITADSRVVDAVVGGGIIYAEGKDGITVKYSRKEVVKFDLATMKKSRIGIITDYATAWTDIKQVTGKDKYDTNVQILRVIQGDEIDSVKTGYTPEIPETLMLKLMPHWLEKNIDKATGKMKPADKQVKEYHSTSAMGQLYDFIMGCPNCKGVEGAPKCKHEQPITGYWNKFMDLNPLDFEKRSLEILRVIDKQEAMSIRPYIERLEHAYRVELGILMEYKNEHDLADDDDSFRAMTQEIFSRYQRLVQDINADPRTVAGVAYHVVYERNDSKGRGLSFPWIACTDGLMLLLAEVGKREETRYRLAPVYGKHRQAGTFTFFRGEVKDTNGTILMEANVEGGDHEVIEVDGRFYVKAPRTSAPIVEMKEPSANRMVQFNIRGFKYNGQTAESAHKMMYENNGIIDLIQTGQYIGIFVNNTQIGVVGGDDDFTAVTLLGQRVRVENLENIRLTYKSQRDGKVRPVSQFDLIATLTGEEVELVEESTESTPNGEPTDLKAEYESTFKSYGFENVEVNIIDGLGEIGTMKVTINNKTYTYYVNRDLDDNIFFTGLRIKSDEIRNTLAQYVYRVLKSQVA